MIFLSFFKSKIAQPSYAVFYFYQNARRTAHAVLQICNIPQNINFMQAAQSREIRHLL
jgi:hypothetical protein